MEGAEPAPPELIEEKKPLFKKSSFGMCSLGAQEEHCRSSSNSGKGARLRASGLAFHTVTLRSVNARREGRPARSLDSEQFERYPLRVEQVEQTV